MFRRLCQYYAECVRLDQGTTVHGKAEAENASFACLSGNLSWPDSDQPPEMKSAIPPGWSEFIKKAKQGSHLYLGAPLNRYKWRDSTSNQKIVFVSPVFLVPVSVHIAQTTIHLRLLGPVRINDGWLERRFKNSDDRRVFLELCGCDLDESDVSSDEPHYRSFAPFCELLSHYYAEWCMEPLDMRRLRTYPAMSCVQSDGIYNRAALFLPGKWRYSARLHDELHKLAWHTTDDELDRTALVHVFGHARPRYSVFGATPRNVPVHSDAMHVANDVLRMSAGNSGPSLDTLLHLASVDTLDEEQSSACKVAATSGLTVVVGPPGTGKSRVVANVLAQSAMAGRSALFASKNHQALEAVVPRLNAMVEPSYVILRLARPFGEPVDVGIRAALSDILSKPSDETATIRRDKLRRRITEVLEEVAAAWNALRATQALHQSLDEAEYVAKEACEMLPQQAIARLEVAHGLASRLEMRDALNVLQPLPTFSLSWKWFLQWLRRVMGIRRAVVTAEAAIAGYASHFQEAGLPKLQANDIAQPAVELCAQLRTWLPYASAIEAVQHAYVLRHQRAQPLGIDRTYEQFAKVRESSMHLSRECLRTVAESWGCELLPDERRQLVNLWAGVQNYETSGGECAQRKLDRLLETAFPIFLRHVPLLATTNLSAGRHLPWRAGGIDLLIIDEASQCDIASVIPLLFRCRRAMLVGDPMQLSHVTRISGALDTQLRRQFGLLEANLERFSYRTTSAYHLAAASESLREPIRLRQHHRCHPDIAQYCNAAFYRRTLAIMTSSSGRQKRTEGLRWTHVSADAEGVAGGGAISRAQVNAIVDESALSEKWNLLSGQGHKAFGQLDYFLRQRPGGCDG